MNSNTLIKLLVGVLLFATWVALVVFKVSGTDQIIEAIKAALLGLGVYHLGDRPALPPAPPVDRQSGRVSLGMLSVIALVLAGCASIIGQHATPRSAQVAYTQACATYGGAFAGALELRRAGKLNRAQIDQVTLLDSQITPICTGPLPADPTAATQQITAAVTSLTILETAKKAN